MDLRQTLSTGMQWRLGLFIPFNPSRLLIGKKFIIVSWLMQAANVGFCRVLSLVIVKFAMGSDDEVSMMEYV